MNSKRFIVFVIFVLLSFISNAQDPLFTQYYNSPLYINPAFVGAGRNDFRVTGVYRTQWQHLPYSLKYMTFGVDKYFNGGPNVGIQVNHFREGFLYTTQPYLLLGYTPLEENPANNEAYSALRFTFGMKVGFTETHIDKSRLLFADQINLDGVTGEGTRFELNKYYQSSNNFDASAGMLVFKGNVMGGIAWNHLTQPKTGLVNHVDTVSLPYRITAHVGWVTDYELFNTDVVGKLNVIGNLQGKSSQVAIGYIMSMLDGLLDVTFQYKNNAALSHSNTFSLGFNLVIGSDKAVFAPNPESRTRFGYSFDLDATRPSTKTTGGTHEVGFLWEKKLQEYSCRPSNLGIDNTTYPWGYH